MPITAADIKFRLSTKSGSAGLSTASTPAESLGLYASTTEMGAGANTLFDDITGAENAASTVDYRCIFIENSHGSLTLQNAVVYLSAQVSGGADITIAVDNIGPVANNSGSAQAASIANETSAPTGVGSYSAPSTSGTGLALGNLAPGQVRGVWVKRTATNSAALSGDGVTFSVTGDTAA